MAHFCAGVAVIEVHHGIVGLVEELEKHHVRGAGVVGKHAPTEQHVPVHRERHARREHHLVRERVCVCVCFSVGGWV